MASSHANENAPQCKTCRCGEGDTNIWTTKTPENLEKQVNKCPNCQVIKSGPLLVSSRGIGWTSWKKRWFILTRTSLVFFRSDPNVPPPKGSEPNLTLGGIDLTNSGSVVVKPDKKLLTVLFPDGRDGRTFTLKAETLEDLNEWKTALENALAQAPSAALAMGQSGILRTDVADSIEASFEQWRDRRPGKSLVVGRPILLALEDIDGSPSFLEKALRYIEQYGIKVEGILRQSADVEEVERRVQEYEQGKNEFSADEDAHVIGDCIKHVLRELPSSPVPASCCTALVEAYRTDRRSRVDAMRAAIYGSFPEPNLHLLQRFVWHTNLLHCDHSDIVGEVDMSTRHHQAVVSQRQRATSSQSRDVVHAGKQKVVAGADGRNRQALGDIGNLVNLRGPDGKPVHEINRPVTRSFGAQLLVNAPVAAAANKKPVAVDVSEAKDGVKAAKQKHTMKSSKPETVVITISPDTVEETKHAAPKSSHPKSSMKKVQTLTSVLTRSKVACGVADKPKNQKIQDIDALDADDQLAVVDYNKNNYNKSR